MDRAIDLIKHRRSIRSYTPQPLTSDEVDTLIQAGLHAPSGHNKQSWLFTVVLNPDILTQINELVKSAFFDMEPTVDAPQELHDAKAKVIRQGDAYCFFYHAPCLIIASNVSTVHNGRVDCACALENMFLAAYDMELAACWVNQLHWQDENQALRTYLETLGIPLSHTICGCGVFGHPGGPIPHAGPRKEGTWHIIE